MKLERRVLWNVNADLMKKLTSKLLTPGGPSSEGQGYLTHTHLASEPPFLFADFLCCLFSIHMIRRCSHHACTKRPSYGSENGTTYCGRVLLLACRRRNNGERQEEKKCGHQEDSAVLHLNPLFDMDDGRRRILRQARQGWISACGFRTEMEVWRSSRRCGHQGCITHPS